MAKNKFELQCFFTGNGDLRIPITITSKMLPIRKPYSLKLTFDDDTLNKYPKLNKLIATNGHLNMIWTPIDRIVDSSDASINSHINEYYNNKKAFKEECKKKIGEKHLSWLCVTNFSIELRSTNHRTLNDPKALVKAFFKWNALNSGGKKKHGTIAIVNSDDFEEGLRDMFTNAESVIEATRDLIGSIA